MEDIQLVEYDQLGEKKILSNTFCVSCNDLNRKTILVNYNHYVILRYRYGNRCDAPDVSVRNISS